MQGKVSMVVPCYNKVDYIGEMLQSVIDQVWDNIELILVNDGSTDGTREIIAEYEPKLKARGVDVIIVDQENAGCCAAVYAGLTKMTGDYYCLVDCDDGIEPEYVSRMAGWLDGHGDYEWTACSYRSHHIIDGKLDIKNTAKSRYPQDTGNLIEKWLLRDVITMVWIYMARTSYVRRCGMVENWCTERRKTYEPLVGIPLMAGEGKLKYFHEPLYRYHRFANDLYGFDKFEKAIAYYDDYLYLHEWAINRLDVSDEEKRRLLSIAKLSYQKELFLQTNQVPSGIGHMQGITKNTLGLLDEVFEPSPNLVMEDILRAGYGSLVYLMENMIFKSKELALREGGRVIGYGALGRAAKPILDLLEGTQWEPTELWDKAAQGGDTVKKPDFASLTREDTLMIFPAATAVEDEVRRELDGSSAQIFSRQDVNEIRSLLYTFPKLSNARLR